MPNPGYFKKGLSKTIPQLICVEIIYNHEDVLATDFSKQMQQAINLDYLRSFIGKAEPPLLKYTSLYILWETNALNLI